CLEVNALTLDGAQGAELTAHWSWAPTLVTEAEVRDLAQRWFLALEGLVGHAALPAAGGRRPRGLPVVGLPQGGVGRVGRPDPPVVGGRPRAPVRGGLAWSPAFRRAGAGGRMGA